MADDDENKDGEGEEGGKGGKKKLLIIGAAVALVLLLGGGAAIFFLPGGDAEEAKEVAAEDVIPRASYHPLDPHFVVNIDGDGRQRFMQIAISVMSRNPEAISAIQAHDPLIRGRLTMLLGAEQFEALRTVEGKEALQQKVFNSIQQVLGEEAEGASIEQVLFTEFVLQ